MLHQALYNRLGTYTAEHRRNIRYRTDLRFLIAVFAWNYRLLVREFLRENHLESLLYTHMAEAFSDYVRQRTVEGL